MNKDFIDELIENAKQGESDKWQIFAHTNLETTKMDLRMAIGCQKSGEYQASLGTTMYAFPGLCELMTRDDFDKNKVRLIYNDLFFTETWGGKIVSRVWLKYE